MPISFRNLGDLGRTGNMMFQAAATIALALRNNEEFIFPKCPLMNDFNIPAKHFVSLKKIKIIHNYEEPFFHYKALPNIKNLNINGYFQSEKYFSDFKEQIKSLFKFKFSINELSGVCGIHVRRGDYTQRHLAHCFNVLDMNYYQAAMKKIGARKYFVFSDDTAWCKRHFVGKKFEIIKGNVPIKDMALMSQSCEHNIIANSSFSWWAAWLNANKNKKVIAPKNWFGPKLAPTHNTRDLIPHGWQII